ncbi:MAG: ribosome silencing factor [Erysipelotrichaceae bacterium]|nr:ribosome silencing factor [Erysipelotrichaceae bacterium]
MSDLLKTAVKALDEKKAENIVVMDFRRVSPLADYFVISHADNFRKLSAIADNVVDRLEEAGYPVKSVEGDESSNWILIDAYDVVVHVFLKEDRVFYGLEKLWMDVPRMDVNELL